MSECHRAPVGKRIATEVEYRDEAHVHVITVCNQAKLNVLDSDLMQDLLGALAQAACDEQARLIVLKGEGERAWIGGADIGEMSKLNRTTARSFITLLHEVCAAILEHPLPIVAAIRGYCLGGGLEVAACCDLRYAASGSRFGMPEVQVGIPSVIEAALLPRLVGVGHARDLVMTGRVIDAETASAWGLVQGVAPEDALDALIDERIGNILSAAPRAIHAQKQLCRIWETRPLAEAVDAGIDAFESAFETEEPRTYMARFTSRRRRE